METRCLHSGQHGLFVSADDDGFDRRVLRPDAETFDWIPSQYGYCQTCGTALRWDPERHSFVDWPEGDRVPHCVYCWSAIAVGEHHLARVQLDVGTFHSHLFSLEPTRVIDGAICSPICLIYSVIDNEILRDVFGR